MSGIDGSAFDPSFENDGQIIGDNAYEGGQTTRRTISNGIMNQIGGGKAYGFDLSSVVGALVNANMQDQIPSLQRQIVNTNVRVSAVSKLEGIMAQLQNTTLKPLEGGLSPYVLTSSATDAVSAKSVSKNISSVPAFTVEATALAKSNTWVFSQAQTSASKAISGAGDLDIQLGDGSPVKIAIPENSTLGDIAKKINDQNLGVQANVVEQADGYHLAVTSDKTGLGNEIQFSYTETTAGDLTAFAASKTEKQVAQDASYTINGIDIVSPVNEVSYSGVNLTLKKTGVVTTVSTTTDLSGVNNAINQFTQNYNELMHSIADLNSQTAGKEYKGSLHEDEDLKKVISQLGDTVLNLLPNNKSLSDIGITKNDDGTISLNQGTLDLALQKNPSLPNELFSTQLSSSNASVEAIDYQKVASVLYPETKSGEYSVNITQLASAATHQATNALTLNGSGKVDVASEITLKMSLSGQEKKGTFNGVNKKNEATITIPAGSYTPEELAAEVQSQANNAEGVSGANASLKVSVDGSNHLVFTSDNVGTLTGFNFESEGSSNTAQLGLQTADMDKEGDYIGQNVIGKINGQITMSDGKYLKAQEDSTSGDNAAGLEIKVNSNVTGDLGTVSLTRGYADRLDALIGTFTRYSDIEPEKSGVLARKLHDYKNDLDSKKLGSLVDQLKEAKAKKERLVESYFQQYKGINSTLSKMNSESQYLKSMFSSHKDD